MLSSTKFRLAAAAAVAVVVAGYVTWRRTFSSSKQQQIAPPPPPAVNKPAGKVPADMAQKVTISALYYYPIKSCAAVQLASAELTPTGLKHDREWCLIKDDGSRGVLTQREMPKMRLITANISDDEKFLLVGCPGAADVIRVPMEETPEQRIKSGKPFRIYNVEKWSLRGEVIDEGDAAAEMLSTFLGIKVRLGRTCTHRHPATSKWHDSVSDANNDEVLMQDFSALHVISAESVAHVQKMADAERERKQKENQEAKQNGGGDDKQQALPSTEPIDAHRFRPNVVVQGTQNVFEEDFWKSFEIVSHGAASSPAIKVRVVKQCGRCTMPAVLPDGTRDPTNFPSRALREGGRNAFYPHQHGKTEQHGLPGAPQRWPMLGLNCAHDKGATGRRIAVGDVVAVTQVVSAQEAIVFE